MGKDAGLVADQVGDAPHLGTTAGQHDAAIDDVGGQLRRRALQCALYGFHDHIEGFGHRLANITGANVDGAGQAGEQVQAAHVHGGVVVGVVGEGGADADFDVFGGALTHHQVVHLLEVKADGVA